MQKAAKAELKLKRKLTPLFDLSALLADDDDDDEDDDDEDDDEDDDDEDDDDDKGDEEGSDGFVVRGTTEEADGVSRLGRGVSGRGLLSDPPRLRDKRELATPANK
ncbi:hypothetical protein FHG87_005090 [Trinorchestia longiramus]|nr:hypothetical protein FHG87_005090 [Trinorchestia longiramus]